MTLKERNIITRGIILKTSIKGDYNRLFSFISPDIGVETAVAFGGERIKSRFCSTVTPFTDLKLFLYKDPKTNLYTLKDISEPLTPTLFSKTLKDIYLTAFFANVILNTLLDSNEYKKYYALLKYSIELVENGHSQKAFLFFSNKLLVLHGQELNFTTCRFCRRKEENMYYSLSKHDIFCLNHTDGESIKLNYADSRVLDDFTALKYNEIKSMDFKIMNSESVNKILIDYIKKIYYGNLKDLDSFFNY